MNFSLDFPDPGRSESSELVRHASLDTTIARLRASMEEENSPIRAIRHVPAGPGEFEELPDSVPA